MNDYLNNEQSVSSDIAKDFIRSVYTYMFAALSISGIYCNTFPNGNRSFSFVLRCDVFTHSSGLCDEYGIGTHVNENNFIALHRLFRSYGIKFILYFHDLLHGVNRFDLLCCIRSIWNHGRIRIYHKNRSDEVW